MPFKNSRHARNKFSGDIISSNIIFNFFLLCLTLKPPPSGNLPIIHKLIQYYKLWHETLTNLPKTSRYTIGFKIDGLFLETTEFILMAANSDATGKSLHLKKASDKLDLLKFFLQVSWEIKAMPNNKFFMLSESLIEIGKMLGGWIKKMKT